MSLRRLKPKLHHSNPKSTLYRSVDLSEKATLSKQKYDHKISGIDGKPLGFYFDSRFRKKTIVETINQYLQPSKNPQRAQIIFHQFKGSKRMSKTSQNPRRKSNDFQMNKTINMKKNEQTIFDQYTETLPIISQTNEDQQIRPNTQLTKRKKHDEDIFTGRSSLITSQLRSIPQEEQMKLFQCSFYSICKIKQNQTIFKAKKYNLEGVNLLRMQRKLKEKGIPILWQKYVPSNTLVYPTVKSLKKQLITSVSFESKNEKVVQYFPKIPYYTSLFKNQNQWLIDIICGICDQLLQVKGQFMNNKIQLDNVYKLGQKDIRLFDWGCSTFKEVLQVLDRPPLTKYWKPTLKDKKRWLCNPYYLAPQILKGYQNSFENIQQEWKTNPTVCDMWSLGCMILQILTIIPLDTNFRSTVKGKKVFRKGLLSMDNFDLEQLLKNQKKLSTSYFQTVLSEYEGLQINIKILIVLEGLLQFEREKRLTAEKVLEILRSF